MLYLVDNVDAPLPPSQNKNAIVSIAIGKKYSELWDRIARHSWERYAHALNMDIIMIRAPLDTSERAQGRSPAWQKLLILSQPWSQRYERILWLDSDVVITPWAQSILDYAPPIEKVGVSISQARLSPAERHIFYERFYNVCIRPDFIEEFTAAELQKNFGLYNISSYGNMYNTGVLMLSPHHHASLFLDVYECPDNGERLYEQPHLSKEIDARGLAHELSARFNWGMLEPIALYVPKFINAQLASLSADDLAFIETLLYKEFKNAYFLHFYGTLGLMQCLREPLHVLLKERQI